MNPTPLQWHTNDLWCFCYQYTIWIICFSVNRCLGIYPIVDWYKYNNVYYITPFEELVIWGWKFYITNPKQGKKALDPRTNTYTLSCNPAIDSSLLPPSVYGFFVVYSNPKKVIIYFYPKTHCIKRISYCYIYEYDSKLNLDESMSLGDLMLQEYPSEV